MRSSLRSRAPLAARLRDRRGQATIEFLLVLGGLLGIIFGGISLSYGFMARSVVVAAARDAARTLAIECGSGDPSAYADAETAAHYDLSAGQQVVDPAPSAAATSAPAPGEWNFGASCSSTTAVATVAYDSPSLFPAILASAGIAHPNTFTEQAAASFPVE